MSVSDIGSFCLALVVLLPWTTLCIAVARPTILRSKLALGLPPILALGLASSGQGAELAATFLIFDSTLGVTAVNRLFLALTAAAWLAAIAVADVASMGSRFNSFLLLAMAGNLLVVVSLEAVVFLTGFAVMSLSLYGLIVHRGDDSARFAGGLYIVFAVMAELLLFAGLIAVSRTTDTLALPLEYHSLPPDWALASIVLGFGIKAGLVPLHMTLPLAYAAAPAAAGIAMAGAMLNAGVLGWMLWLPLGQFAVPALGTTLMSLGVVGIIAGVAFGLVQRDPRALLAYSSVSQVALILLVLGTALIAPAHWIAMMPLLTLFILHHALAKTAAFCLSCGVVFSGSAARALPLLPALALIGVPWTLGFVGKSGIKGTLLLGGDAGALIASGLPLASLGTTLLMARWWTLVVSGANRERSASAAVAAAALLMLAYALISWRQFAGMDAPQSAQYLDALWPALAGLALTIFVIRTRPRLSARATGMVPPGDLAVLLASAVPVKTMAARVLRLLADLRHAGMRRSRGIGLLWPAPRQDREIDTALPAYMAVVLLMLLLYFVE